MLDGFQFDPQIVGLTLNIVGAFFIVNSLIFKKPRRFLFDYLGIDKRRPLREIREHVLSQVQLMIGFVFLICGYFLQIGYQLSNGILERDTFLSDPGVLTIAGTLILSMLAVTLVLKIFQILWTRWSFRKLLTNFFREHPAALSQHPQVAKEVGEILGVEHRKEDSVADYLERLRAFLEIESPAATAERDLTLTPRPRAPVRRDSTTLVSTHPATPPRIGS